jgi:xylan 1,4-beta-xylosidase
MRIVRFSALFFIAGALIPQTQPPAETISIDASAPTRTFPHYWDRVFGSGRAILSLRESYRDDLRALKRNTGVQYVRFHNIFHDEVGLYDTDANNLPVYNFSYIDQIYDGLLALGVKPFVELSFMPQKLALNRSPHPFWYKPLPSPPNDYNRWDAMILAFVRHLVDRYGVAEVASWYFEVWNEPNLDFWNGEPREASYYDLYDHTASAIKAVSPKLRVGGPATAQAAWADRFLAHCAEKNVPVDFVSTHVYANDKPEDIFGTHDAISRADMVARAVRKVYDQVKRSRLPNVEIHWSEYNASYMNEVDVTDSPFMGPWLAHTIAACDGFASTMSYWTFSDVFEEQGVVKSPFYGGYGLIAERGIPKASFNVFSLLNRLGFERMENRSDSALVTKRPDGALVFALWNYADPAAEGTSRSFSFDVKNVPPDSKARMIVIDRDHGSALEAWREMGSPRSPALDQLDRLKKIAGMPDPQPLKLDAGTPITLPPKSFALIEVSR